jgi:urocanate hydratase
MNACSFLESKESVVVVESEKPVTVFETKEPAYPLDWKRINR